MITPGMFREASHERADALRAEARRAGSGSRRSHRRSLRVAVGTRLLSAGLRLMRGEVS